MWESAYSNDRRALFVIGDFNILQRRPGALPSDAQSLEDSLLGGPSAGETGLRRGRFSTILLFPVGEVAVHKRLVVDVDGGDGLDIDADLGVLRRGGFGERFDHLARRVGFRLVGGSVFRSGGGVGEGGGFLVHGNASLRVEEDLALLVVGVGGVGFGDEEGVVDEAVVEVSVRALLSGFDFLLVRLVLRVLEGGVEVLGMDTDGLCAFLAETERCDGEGFDAVGLYAVAGINDVVEFLHELIDVVGVTVAGDETAVEHLQAPVEHPGASGTFGMTGEVFLEYAKKSVALFPA